MSVRIRFEWVDSGPSPDKVARATMAALRVDTNAGTVTATVDRRSRIYSNEIIVPLFSVAEWLVTNWWHLWYEVADTNGATPEFESRHNLAFVGDGFVLPRLTIAPSSSTRMHLAWTQYKPRYARIEFLDDGYQHVEREELEAEFRGLIEAVLDRIHADPATSAAAENLGRAWSAVNSLGDDEVEFSRAAALFGVDPFDLRDDVADAIVAFWERADPSVREDALALADGAELSSIADWLDDVMGTVVGRRGGSDWSSIPPRVAATGPRGRAVGSRLQPGSLRARAGRRQRRPRRPPPDRASGGSLATDASTLHPYSRTRRRGYAGMRNRTARRLGHPLPPGARTR